MSRVRIDADDRALMPALGLPEFGIQKNFYAFADLNRVRHGLFFTTREPEQADPDYDRDAAVDRPLRVARHKTARQDVDALQEPDPACQDEEAADNS